MVTGEDFIRKAGARRAENPNKPFVRNFKLPNDNETAIVRFLEERKEFACCYVHERRFAGRRPIIVPCLDQDETGIRCPGCEHTDPKVAKRVFKGWINLIRFDAPKLKRGDDGRGIKDASGNWMFDGTEAELQVWERGITTFEDLVDLDIDYKGLSSRPFKVTRKGVDLNNTKYKIGPADIDSGAVPFSEEELKLIENKNDLTQFTAIPTYDQAAEDLGVVDNSGGVGPQDVSPTSPFNKRASRFLED